MNQFGLRLWNGGWSLSKVGADVRRLETILQPGES
jgi:hypothetical protein